MFLILGMQNSPAQDLRKLTDKEIDPARVEMSRNFAENYLNASKKGTYYQFADEAVDAVKSQLGVENQKIVYSQLKAAFGDFLSLSYAETWAQGSGTNSLNIVRFRSVFEKAQQTLEVRVVLDAYGKIAGFFITPWKDNLN